MFVPQVLVLDDDRSACQIVCSILRTRGYVVDFALDVQLAMQLVKERDFKLAVLDYEMPEMNGVEFLNWAGAWQPQLESIFVTAYPCLHTVFPAINAGARRVLPKPVDSRELLAVVESIIGPPAAASLK